MASLTFSSTVFHGKIDFVYCWKTNIISSRGAVIALPFRRIAPSDGRESPAMMWSSVDLPQPEGPISATKSPWPTANVTSRNA